MSKEKQVQKQTMARDALKALQEIEASVRLENIIQDNKIKFKHNDKQFRVRKPTLAEQQEIDNEQRKRYTELIDDDSYIFRAEWIEKHKKRGIDIDKMETQIKTNESEIKNLLLRLAKIADKKAIEEIKKEILTLKDKQIDLTIEKTDLLRYSIEDQLQIHVNSYTAYTIVESFKDNKWVKHFDSYQDFMKSSDLELMNLIFYYLNFLIYGT